KGGGRELADELNVPLLGSIPLDPAVVAAGDSGDPVVLAAELGPAAIALSALVARLIEVVPPAELETCTGRIAKLLADLENGAA
ncbi:MAG: P-loop NTPase, partial [Actinobacteria bacterium]|nr:P-loop NTPase [Actinomycetota bacterium]